MGARRPSLPDDMRLRLLPMCRSMYNLYSMARQYEVLQPHPGSVIVRFEDLRHAFNATVAQLLLDLGLAPSGEAAVEEAGALQASAATLYTVFLCWVWGFGAVLHLSLSPYHLRPPPYLPTCLPAEAISPLQPDQ